VVVNRAVLGTTTVLSLWGPTKA